MAPGRTLLRSTSFALVAALTLASVGSAWAQQRGTDVGGQPARRKLTKMPRLVTFVPADYPPEKKAAGAQASVTLTIEIAASGLVTNVTVANSVAPDFDAAAVAAAQKFVFEPAEVDDKPAPAKITYRYDFTLVDEPPPTAPAPAAPPPTAKAPAPAAPTAAIPEVEDVEVRGRPRERRETVDYAVRAERARKVAGTQGDVLKVVQNLPGVSRPPVASGQIVVWGSAPRDTRVYVDGVDIPALYHGSGLRGTINSDLVSSIDLVPGAFGAEYGRGLGGLVRVETRQLPRGTHGYVDVDTLDGSAMVSTELGERVRIAGALRYGWIDRVFEAVSSRDIGDTFPLPRYGDAQIKATVDLRAREAVDVVLLGSTDALDRTVASPDPAKVRRESTANDFWRAYARYTSVSASGDTTTIFTPFVGQDRSSLESRFGAVPAVLAIDADRYGLRTSTRTRVAKHVTVVAGLDTLGTASRLRRQGSVTLPPREGDIAVFGQPPGDEVAYDAWSTHVLDVAPHAYADVRLGPVTVTPGVRFDAFLIEGSRKTPKLGPTPSIGFSRLETAFAPRASARWDALPRLSFNAAYGQYHQAPEPEDLSAVFGTPDLALSRATHVTVGESLKITESLSADVVAFRKTMRDLVVRSRLSNPLLARALTQNGEGESYGVQFLVRQELWHGFFGWVSYAVSKSRRRFDGDEDWRAFDFDQPHVLSVVAFQELGPWGIGARFRYGSGNPRTPVVGSVYDARSDRYDPVFGPQNGTRIPAFWQFDLRVERSFRLSEATRMLAYADVQNLTNRHNAEELVYSGDFRERGIIRGLPIFAIVGVRIER